MKLFHCLNCGKENQSKGYSYSNKYCDNKCQGKHRQKVWFEENQTKFEEGRLTSRASAKRFVKERDGEHCSICNQPPEYNGKRLVMVLDHIDGDASNNNPLNYRLVCPNCDSQLPTYKGANRGNGRATKGMKWFDRL